MVRNIVVTDSLKNTTAIFMATKKKIPCDFGQVIRNEVWGFEENIIT